MKVNVLVDNHLHAGMDAYTIADFSPEAMERFVDAVRPSRLTVFAIGHDGLAQYPSKIGKRAPGLEIDLVEVWRRIARDRDISFGIYVSTLRNDVLLAEQPTWVRSRLDGTTSGKIDHTSPFLEQWLKPILKELHSRYVPDGFFFDGDYWAVGESASVSRAEAAFARWPERGPHAINSLNPSEHRLLTVETYGKYLKNLGEFLQSLDKRLESSVNLAFTFRHPTSPPNGLGLVTSDLPPFYGALESWIETAVILPHDCRRDLVVPLYSEPEGGGRKYKKSVPQLLHETAPVIAHGDQIHVYFPMSRKGTIDQTYVGSLNEMRSEIERQESNTAQTSLKSDFDVLCLSDTETLQLSQNFGCLRGAFLAACAAGLNVGVATTQRCWERLTRARMLIIPSGLPSSPEAERLVLAAISSGIKVLGPDDAGFGDRMMQSNHELNSETIDLLSRAYLTSPRETIWSNLNISRPWTTFIRGLTNSDGTWRLFLWNGIKDGEGIGRHVIDRGAGFAGSHKVSCADTLKISRWWGYGDLIAQNSQSIEIDIHGAYTVVEGYA